MCNVIFDLDGTLVDSSKGVLSSLNIALNKRDIRAVSPIIKSIIGPSLNDILSLVSGSVDPKVIFELSKEFKLHYDKIGCMEMVVYPGIENLLNSLNLNGCELYIVTNKRGVPTQKMIDVLSWKKYFAKVYSLDNDTFNAKTKGDLIGKVILHNNMSKDKTLYIGDTIEDFKSAEVAGIEFIHVRWGYGRALFDCKSSVYNTLELKNCIYDLCDYE